MSDLTIKGSGNVNTVSDVGDVNTSVQMAFAMLQMELAKTNKDDAMGKIEEIRQSQAKATQLRDAINNLKAIQTSLDKNVKTMGSFDANASIESLQKEQLLCQTYLAQEQELKATASAGEKNPSSSQGIANKASSGESESTMMTQAMEDYYKKNGIDYDSSGVSKRQNAGEWDRAISSLEARSQYLQAMVTCKEFNIDIKTSNISKEDLDVVIAKLESAQESVGSDQQTLMVLIQESMGQYNSYTQGASAQISKFSDVLSTLAQSK